MVLSLTKPPLQLLTCPALLRSSRSGLLCPRSCTALSPFESVTSRLPWAFRGAPPHCIFFSHSLYVYVSYWSRQLLVTYLWSWYFKGYVIFLANVQSLCTDTLFSSSLTDGKPRVTVLIITCLPLFAYYGRTLHSIFSAALSDMEGVIPILQIRLGLNQDIR